MEVWRKGQAYVLMLDRKQCLLQNSLAKSENQLTQVKRMIALHLQEIEDINQQIKACMDLGLLSREYIYKSIREQGIFLTKKQLISNKITQLESEKYELEQQIQQSNTSIFSLKKKNHKLTDSLNKRRINYIRRGDNNAENEIQDIANYVKTTI